MSNDFEILNAERIRFIGELAELRGQTLEQVMDFFQIDVWNEYLAWTSGYTEIVGLTAIGRATVEVLDLNREGLINQGQMLHRYGKHPPE